METCINLEFLTFLEYFLNASKRLKVPIMLLSINCFGESIERSTCVSAAKLNIPIGLYL